MAAAIIRGASVLIAYRPTPTGPWTEIQCEVTSADWQWGATVPLGPITVSEGGSMRISVWDPLRQYDPTNAASPLASVLRVGLPVAAWIDAAPAWTGALQSWAWDRATSIATLSAIDPIAQMAQLVFPDAEGGVVYATTYAQIIQVLDRVGWPAGSRYFPTPSGVVRGSRILGGSTLDYLAEITFAELGALYPRRDGKIGWHNRAGVAPPAISATINCGGAGLVDMTVTDGLGRVRNKVIISRNVYAGAGVPAVDARTVYTTGTELQLETLPPPAAAAHVVWALAVLDALERPAPLTALGTILPTGAQVKEVVCAEYGARWNVVTGSETRVVRVIGMKVNVAPGAIEVDAVTEDEQAPPPATPYYDAVLTNSRLFHYWRLGEASPTQVAVDERAYLPGTYVGSPTLGVAGAISDGNTAMTAATGKYVNVPYNAVLNQGDSGSYEAWVRIPSLTSAAPRTILGRGHGGYQFRISTTGRLELARSGLSAVVASTVTLPVNAWTHVVAAKGGPGTKLYINGVDRTGTVTEDPQVNPPNPLTIGGDTNADGTTHRDYMVGDLDEVAIYQGQITAAEVLDHYNKR